MAHSLSLPHTGRPRQILGISSSGYGKETKEVVVEDDAISITCYTASLGVGATLNIKIEQIGNNLDNVKLIKRFDTITIAGAPPYTESFNVGGTLRITAEYTGAVTFDMQGRAISGSSAVADGIQKVTVIPNEADLVHREQVVLHLHQIEEKLDALLNHQRFITKLEEPGGNL